MGDTDVVRYNYYTYNIDLKTGEKLTYKDIYTQAGFTDTNIESKVEASITKIMKEKLNDFKDPLKESGDGGYFPDGTNFDTYNNQSINNYKTSVQNNTIDYYLTFNGKLNIIVDLSIPAGIGTFPTIIEVDNSNQNSDVTTKPVEKIDNTKDWVYEASYDTNKLTSSYETNFKKKYYLKDINVPYLNINSSYAKNANNEIKRVFTNALEVYKRGIEDKESYIEECHYNQKVTTDYISIILTLATGGTNVIQYNYYTYNLNLKNGEKLSYQDVYKLAGFTTTNIDKKVEESITRVMKEKLNDIPDNEFNTYNNKSLNNYKTSIQNNNIHYFLASNGKLNIIVNLEIPAGIGTFPTIIEISN